MLKFIKGINKQKDIIYVYQLDGAFLKVAKCFVSKAEGRVLTLEITDVPAGAEESKISQLIKSSLKSLGYNNNRLFFSFPRIHATCRYLKVPTQSDNEIEKIVSLQAAKYLPYSAEELITGYEILQKNEEGYAEINMTILHKDAISKFLEIARELKIDSFHIFLSSYGVSELYNSFSRNGGSSVLMLLDIGSTHTEAVFIQRGNVIFSRSFKSSITLESWKSLCIEEMEKTYSVYLRETGKPKIEKVIVFNSRLINKDFLDLLARRFVLPVEVIDLSVNNSIVFSPQAKSTLDNSQESFISLIGLALKKQNESLNLLPMNIKEKNKLLLSCKSYIKLSVYVLTSALLLWSAVFLNFKKKVEYLKLLDSQLAIFGKEAKSLEEIETRVKVMERKAKKEGSLLEIVTEIYSLTPQEIHLINFSYDSDKEILLRGQTKELNDVFNFVSKIESNDLLKKFQVRVKYATKRKTQTAEFIDFEVSCIKIKK